MAEPIVELIARNLEAAVNAVIEGNVVEGNAYNQTLKAQRPKHVDFESAAWADLTVLISQIPRAAGESECMRVTRTQNFLLCAIVMDSLTASVTIDTRQNQVSADIEKALLVDRYRGGYALDTKVGDAVPFDDDDLAITGIAISVAVDYKTLEKDPYTQG